VTRTYALRVFIREGSDEFWDKIREEGKTGCDDVLKEVRETLADRGFMPELGTEVELVGFREE